ncbi:hypothetical protein D9M69_506010 [compost metagenome]
MRRRSFIALGLTAGALAWWAGRQGLPLSGMHQGRLSPDSRVVLTGAAYAILQGCLPTSPAAARIALLAMLDRIDELIGQLPSASQAELSQLMGLLCSAPGRRLLAGLEKDWNEASVDEIDAALEGMRHSSLAPRQQAYLALHEIITGAYFADSSSWPRIGYPGPMTI